MAQVMLNLSRHAEVVVYANAIVCFDDEDGYYRIEDPLDWTISYKEWMDVSPEA